MTAVQAAQRLLEELPETPAVWMKRSARLMPPSSSSSSSPSTKTFCSSAVALSLPVRPPMRVTATEPSGQVEPSWSTA